MILLEAENTADNSLFPSVQQRGIGYCCLGWNSNPEEIEYANIRYNKLGNCLAMHD